MATRRGCHEHRTSYNRGVAKFASAGGHHRLLKYSQFLGILGTPKGSIYDRALGSAAYVDSVVGIREGFAENVLPELPVDIQVLVKLLMVHAVSPIELAVIPPATPELPFPELLMTVAFDFADVDAVNEFLNLASLQIAELEIATPLDANGNGILLLAGLPVSVHYGASDTRFHLHASMGGDPTRLKPLFEAHYWLTSRSNYGDIEANVTADTLVLPVSKSQRADTPISASVKTPSSLVQLLLEQFPTASACLRDKGMLVRDSVRTSLTMRCSGPALEADGGC